MSSKNFKDLEHRFNAEVNKVQEWLLANGLSVQYIKKTQYMLIHRLNSQNENANKFKLIMGGHEIEKTDSYRYLGVTIDHKLNWKLHVNELCSKLASVCGVLSKVRHYLDRNSLMLIYNSLFETRLSYAVLGWGTAPEHVLNKLKVLQNRAVRFITFSSFRTSMAPLYSSLKILSLSNLFYLQKSHYFDDFSKKSFFLHSVTTKIIARNRYSPIEKFFHKILPLLGYSRR